MNKTTLIMIFLVFNTFVLKAQDAFRGFEDTTQDNWNFTSNIPFYNQNSNTDLWTEYSQANGRIDGAYAGSAYLAGRDLDNPHTESITGEDSPEHILTFDSFAINGLGAEFTFKLYYVFLDKFDYIYYELAYDNGTSWTSSDEHINVFSTTQGGKFSLSDWKKISFDVPTGVEYVRMRLVIYQNGNGYLGFDNFEIKTNTLSTSNNAIEGFSFGPNPTQGVLRLRAKTILDKATVYDVIGKEIFMQKGNSTEMVLNLSHLPQGVYFARVESNSIIQTIKVIKR